jgi:hypothetical protein
MARGARRARKWERPPARKAACDARGARLGRRARAGRAGCRTLSRGGALQVGRCGVYTCGRRAAACHAAAHEAPAGAARTAHAPAGGPPGRLAGPGRPAVRAARRAPGAPAAVHFTAERDAPARGAGARACDAGVRFSAGVVPWRAARAARANGSSRPVAEASFGRAARGCRAGRLRGGRAAAPCQAGGATFSVAPIPRPRLRPPRRRVSGCCMCSASRGGAARRRGWRAARAPGG